MQTTQRRVITIVTVVWLCLLAPNTTLTTAQELGQAPSSSPLPWTPLLAAWITGLTRDVSNPQRFYAVGHRGGGRSWKTDPERNFFKSDDGGASWSESFIGEGRAGQMGDIVMSADGTIFASSAGGILRSRDAGQSWTWSSDITRPAFRTGSRIGFTVRPEDPRTVYAWTDSWVAITADAGDSWEQLPMPLQRCNQGAWVFFVDPDVSTRLYASGCGISRSDDAGRSWQQIATPWESGPLASVPRMIRHPRLPNELIAIVNDNRPPREGDAAQSRGQRKLWRTSDLGETWGELHPSDGRIDDVLFDPRDATGNTILVRVYGAENGLLVSRDHGASWESFEPSPAPQAGACWNTASTWMKFIDDQIWIGFCNGAWRRPAL